MNPILHYHTQRRRARLNDTQAETLLRIAREPQALTRLAEDLETTTGNMTHVARYLEQRGLASREDAPHDRRKQLLTISPEGEKIVSGFSWRGGGTVVNGAP